jgi:hypothetical protein
LFILLAKLKIVNVLLLTCVCIFIETVKRERNAPQQVFLFGGKDIGFNKDYVIYARVPGIGHKKWWSIGTCWHLCLKWAAQRYRTKKTNN